MKDENWTDGDVVTLTLPRETIEKQFGCSIEDLTLFVQIEKAEQGMVTELDVTFEDERDKSRIPGGTPKIYPCTSEPTAEKEKQP